MSLRLSDKDRAHMCRIAMISVHGCPLSTLGAGEAGGLQMYVRALSEELGQRGMTVDVFDHLPEFISNVRAFRARAGVEYQYVHSHYWLSGWAGNLLARRWDVPH